MSTALSPNDIRNYEFPNQMRGYDKDEVRELLQQVAAALEDLKQENLKIAIERDTVRTQLEALKQFEDTIKSAAIDARRNADTLVANAKREVGEILNKARAEAETIVGSRADEARVLDEQITRLRMVKVSYQTKLKNLIESHLELIDELQRVKEPEVPRMQPARPTAAAEPSADDTAKTPTITSIPATPAASETEPARAAGDFRRDLRTATTAPEADWIRQAREANIPAVVPPTLRPFKPTNGLEVEEVTEVTRKKLETFSTEPEPAEPAHTEEANAAEQIVAVGPAPTAPPPPQPAIDPELAAALESYQMSHATAPELSRRTAAPAAGPTAAAASERDESMRATLNDFDERNRTGRIPAPETPEEADASTEHNLIDIDQPIGDAAPAARPAAPRKSDAAVPEDIARELDEVAARFEEEMDKAARS